MQVVLLRVGIDTSDGSGGMLGPLYQDGTFELIPIKDGLRSDTRTYGNTRGAHGLNLADYFSPQRQAEMRTQAMHVDPEFETFTYGDPSLSGPKTTLSKLTHGDLLVFYAGLEGYDFKGPPALYIVGYFEVEWAGLATAFDDETMRTQFAANFHVRNRDVFADQRERLMLVKGGPGSRLLKWAVKISEDGEDKAGSRIHVLSQEMREIFGMQEHPGIQRSVPRWVEEPYVKRAAVFMRVLR